MITRRAAYVTTRRTQGAPPRGRKRFCNNEIFTRRIIIPHFSFITGGAAVRRLSSCISRLASHLLTFSLLRRAGWCTMLAHIASVRTGRRTFRHGE